MKKYTDAGYPIWSGIMAWAIEGFVEVFCERFVGSNCGILYAKVMSSGGQGAAGQRLRDESDAAVWIECIMHPCVEVRKSMSTVTIFQIAIEF